jgi:type IV secretion system protein TrbB
MEKHLMTGANEQKAIVYDSKELLHEHTVIFAPAGCGGSINVGLSLNFDLDDLVALGTIEQNAARTLKDIVATNNQNILVIGGIGAGKTTLLQALTNEISKSQTTARIAVVQGTDEIKCKHENLVSLTYPKDHSNTTMALGKYVRSALRMNLDRLVVGDLNHDEAKEILNCTTPWMASIMGTSANSALHNLEQFSIANGYTPCKSQIAEQVHIIVLIEKTNSGHKVTNISRVHGFDEVLQKYHTVVLFSVEDKYNVAQ